MARPLRINYEGAVYHVTSRGNERRRIFLSEKDREAFLGVLAHVTERYQWICHGFCLMDNHYHLLIETPLGNLSEGMRQLNGVYTQRFNQAHKRVGHLFQGRFKGILVEKNFHLLALCRYVVLNPVRAGICRAVEEYKWSSYRTFVGLDKKPPFLKTHWVLSHFGRTEQSAIKAFMTFINEGVCDHPWERLKGQIYFGSDAFIESLDEKSVKDNEIPRAHSHPLRPPLEQILNQKDGIKIAYRDHKYHMKQIADQLGVHYATISRRLKSMEK